MKKALLSLIILLLCNYGFSQELRLVEVPRGAKIQTTDVVDGVATHNYSTKSNIPVNGIPFLNELFTSGNLELLDGSKSGEVLLRYNVAKDLFEILRNNDTLTLTRPFAVKYVYLEEKIFIFDPKLREDAERSLNGYFQLRVDGKLSLYIKRRKDLSFDSFVANYKGGGGTKEYYYIDKVSFVGKSTEGKAFLIVSAKSFLSNLVDHKSEMKAFIKQNKIKFKQEEDLVRLFEYYNSL